MKRLIQTMMVLMATCLLLATEIPEDVKVNIEERLAKDWNKSIVIALVDKSGVSYYNYGHISDGGPTATENHVYEIGSVSKTFTCLLLADMVTKGEVKLDDPIEKYLPPGIKAPTRNGQHITLAHLATHRSSLPRMPGNFPSTNPADPYSDYTQEMLFTFIDSCELTRDIGSEFEYSNLGMGLLGNLLARAAGTDYDTLLHKRILTPLGMNKTWLTVNDKNRAMVAQAYNEGSKVSNWELNCMSPAGAIKSSTAEMARYVAAQMGLKKTALDKAIKASHNEVNGTGMGMAWMFSGDDILEHGGATGGYRAYVGFRRDNSLGVVVLTNSDRNVEDLGKHILDPSQPMRPVLGIVSQAMNKVIEVEGIAAGIAFYKNAKANHADEYEFKEEILNNMGYKLLNEDRPEDAVEIFKLNLAEYPKAANPNDSLAEAYAKLAIKYYTRAAAMDPNNKGAAQFLVKMGVAAPAPDAAAMTAEQLDPYLGKYQLGPGMIFAVTREETQLFVQLTGQKAIPVFHKEGDTFYAKVVDAQITFNRDSTTKVIALTLHQNGDHDAKRIVD